MRYAVYFLPAHGSPLERFGAALLGYDPYTGERVTTDPFLSLDPSNLRDVTREPLRYGFHATIKAPMRLVTGWDEHDVLRELERFAATRPTVAVGRLSVERIGRFIALVPAAPSRDLGMLAAECVAALDLARAPLEEAERARRLQGGLTQRQAALLDRWGYPYVFDEFRFHMTLTGALEPEPQEEWLARLGEAFGPLGRETFTVDALSLLREDNADTPFRVVARVPLRGEGRG
jgi:putative phosphonate metabolism protein